VFGVIPQNAQVMWTLLRLNSQNPNPASSTSASRPGPQRGAQTSSEGNIANPSETGCVQRGVQWGALKHAEVSCGLNKTPSPASFPQCLIVLKQTGGIPSEARSHKGVVEHCQIRISQFEIIQAKSTKAKLQRDKCLAARTDALNDSQLWFHYLYSKKSSRWKTERTEWFRCPFCQAPCRSAPGMHTHLQSEHDHFIFSWTANGEDITVACRPPKVIGPIHDSSGKYGSYPFEHISRNWYESRPKLARKASPSLSDLVQAPEVLESIESERVIASKDVNKQEATPENLKTFANRNLVFDKQMSALGKKSGDVQVSATLKRKFQQVNVRGAGMKREEKTSAFFHSRTCQPVTSEELRIGNDSDDEVDYEDFVREDKRALDEFMDIAAEEKEVMHMWNTVVKRHPLYSDGCTGSACLQFSEEHRERLCASPALKRAFLFHLLNLSDYGLVTSEHFRKCFSIIDSKRKNR